MGTTCKWKEKLGRKIRRSSFEYMEMEVFGWMRTHVKVVMLEEEDNEEREGNAEGEEAEEALIFLVSAH
jgi:hypothetical protein